MNLLIRKARTSDAPVIAEFNALMAMETEHRTLNAKVLRKGVESLLGDPGSGLYFVAESKGTVVGQTMITYEWSDWRDGNFWWI